MFRSRQTIAFSIIVLYFIPILFLSLYSINGGPNHTWTLFSFGLFSGIAGTLALFLMMIQFEATVSASKSDEDDSSISKHSLFEDDQAHIDFDSIILNLNTELSSKKQESEKLEKANLELKLKLEEALKTQELIQASKVEEEDEEEEEEEELFNNSKGQSFESRALDIEKIEQNLYGKDNRVEVTRL